MLDELHVGACVISPANHQAAAEGLAKGLSQGRAAEARKFLRLLLRRHFPELESLEEIDAIFDVDALESIGESIFDASSPDPLRAAILTAARPN